MELAEQVKRQEDYQFQNCLQAPIPNQNWDVLEKLGEMQSKLALVQHSILHGMEEA